MEFSIGLLLENERPDDWTNSFVEVAKAAREMGFQSVRVGHRPAVRGEGDDTLAPLMTLASLIHEIPNMTLIAGLILPVLDAVVVANQAATLSRLCGERLVLLAIVGDREAEYQRLGADFWRRGRRVDESIEVMRRLWSEKRVDFDGEFFHLTDMGIYPRPKSGHPPIWIGGNSKAAINRAARVGDGWGPVLLDPQALGKGVARLRQGLADRPMPTVATYEWVRPLLPLHEAKDENVHVAGTPEEMIATLNDYQAAGLDHLAGVFVANSMDEQLSQMRIFSEQVMPHFTE